jgi:hypothetical protein
MGVGEVAKRMALGIQLGREISHRTGFADADVAGDNAEEALIDHDLQTGG